MAQLQVPSTQTAPDGFASLWCGDVEPSTTPERIHPTKPAMPTTPRAGQPMTATDGLTERSCRSPLPVTDPAAATPSLASYGPQSSQPTELSQSSGANAAPCSCYAAKQPRNARMDSGFGAESTAASAQKESGVTDMLHHGARSHPQRESDHLG
jgi:hypothetical protein